MNENAGQLDLKEVKLSIQKAIVECSRRGLLHGTKWYVAYFVLMSIIDVVSISIQLNCYTPFKISFPLV